MKEKCMNCGAEWEGCPNCNSSTPNEQEEYSPQNSMLMKLAKPMRKMSLSDERPEDTNSKYRR